MFERNQDLVRLQLFNEYFKPDECQHGDSAWVARWLAALPLRKCWRHSKTALRLDRQQSLRLCADPKHGRVDYLDDDFEAEYAKIKAGFYRFTLAYHCLACKVQHALVPPEFVESSIETYRASNDELEKNLSRCGEFITQVNDNGCGFLLLVGHPGTGKTRLACNILRELNCTSCLYVRQGRVTLELRRSYGVRRLFVERRSGRREDYEDDDPPPMIWEVLQKEGVLVLDEIGSKAMSSDEILLFDEVLRNRFEYRKPTILISNLPISGSPERPGFKEFLGDPLMDRIRNATGNGKFMLQFSDTSFRRQQGEDYLSGIGDQSL